jgi:hypothetical protein
MADAKLRGGLLAGKTLKFQSTPVIADERSWVARINWLSQALFQSAPVIADERSCRGG